MEEAGAEDMHATWLWAGFMAVQLFVAVPWLFVCCWCWGNCHLSVHTQCGVETTVAGNLSS